MPKLSKAERKAAKKERKQEKNASAETQVQERDLGYDADYYANDAGDELEAVRTSFVLKPEWYYDMFRAGDVTHQKDQLVVRCSDGELHSEKDASCAVCRDGAGNVSLVSDKALKDGWRHVATSTSRKFRMNA